ncbi:MAG TPA: zf-HC2 domain-containing protein [Planctomycetota bacterium]|nr:zf-HC2 domain-containing protein [Planctomycetota bacterium]
MSCASIRPLLFAMHENALDAHETARVRAHLARCHGCRREAEAEARLTAALLQAPRRRRRLAFPVAGAVAAVLVATVLLRPSEAFGSIQPTSLTPEMTLRDGQRRPLERSNHVALPTGESCRIEIRGTGDLAAVGPAVFELDLTDGRWKLTLLRGEVRAEIERGAELEAVTLRGRQRLGAGPHRICLQAADDKPPPPVPGPSVAELMDRGHKAFFTDQDFAAAEEAYRAALAHPSATGEQRASAHFYLGASLGRQEKYAEAVKVQADWLAKYPKDETRHYVLLFQGIYHRALGNERAAAAAWQTIVDEAPDSDLAAHARMQLGQSAVKPAATPADRGARPLPAAAARGGYAVVEVALTDPAFVKVARAIADFHKARTVAWDGRDGNALERDLAAAPPDEVLFVVQPEVLDVNLHRRILLASARLDEDILPDFAFGYFTARDGRSLAALWERTQAVRKGGLAARRWVGTSVASSIKSTVYPGDVPDIARAAGFVGDQLYWGSREADPDVVDFVRGHLPALEKAGVVTMTGCGDPQGIWLFSDRRNIDRNRHWEFDPAKVGRDPEGEMPRITASFLAPLRLDRPICWSGVCHAGATRRVFVEGDIVSTFGRTDRATVYELDPGESFCLALFDAGAAAFLCPIAANHGMSVSREVDFALENGATLGETIKSTWDDVWLAAGGAPQLALQVAGEPQRHDGEVMQGGGANRILIGDPSLAPFAATPHPLEQVDVRRTEQGFDVEVTWRKGFHSRGWDMYGADRARDWCIRARVPIDDLVKPGGGRVTAAVEVFDEKGQPLPHVLTRAEPEAFRGHRYLHLQANAPRAGLAGEFRRAVFHVTVAQ